MKQKREFISKVAPAPPWLEDDTTIDGIKIHLFGAWGECGSNHLFGEMVPRGEVWLVRSCGCFTDMPVAVDYMIQHVVWRPFLPDTSQYYLIPVARTPGAIVGTPVLALSRPMILLYGEGF